MNKFLFTDGTNGVIEVHTPEELETLLNDSIQVDRIKIWVFSSNEWISYATFHKQYPNLTRKAKPVVFNDTVVANHSNVTNQAAYKLPPQKKKHWIKKYFFLAAASAGIFLVFNFTKIKWEKAEPLNTIAVRPANVPEMNIDSLIEEIEYTRAQPLDRNTRGNLRLRNTWPERILLQVMAAREMNGSSARFFNVTVSVDNTTGFNLDNAVVKLSVWKSKRVLLMDTLQFSNIRYDKLATRELSNRYKGDSISIAFESIRAKAFNFCYSAATKNSSGNYNDKWFCR